METCFNYCQKDKAFFSSDERKFITRIRKLKEKYPDKVRIILEPHENGGCIYCELPPEWLKVVPKRIMSEEHRQKLIDSSIGNRFIPSRNGTESRKNGQKTSSGCFDE